MTTKNYERCDELLAYIEGMAEGQIADCLEEAGKKRTVEDVKVDEIESGTDDGLVFGTYRATANGGTVSITIDASACYTWEKDNYDEARESHYATTGESEELEDVEIDVTSIEITAEK